MITVCRDEISARPAGTDFSHDYMWKLASRSAVSTLFHKISSRWQMLFKIGVLKIFAVFTGKTLALESLFKKIADLKACKETPTQVFSCEYCEVFKKTFLAERLRRLLL